MRCLTHSYERMGLITLRKYKWVEFDKGIDVTDFLRRKMKTGLRKAEITADQIPADTFMSMNMLRHYHFDLI